MMSTIEGTFLRHEACEKCGSTDAKAVYSNDTAYCFSCEAFFPSADGETIRTPRRRIGMISNLEYKPLNKRKIALETARKYGYGYAHHNGRAVQVAPYYNNGELVAQHLRTADKDFSWTGEAKKLELFGQHLWRIGGKRLVITEGEIDCLTIAQVFNLKWAVVSVPNGAQSAKKYVLQNIEFIESYDEVVFAFDNDEFGRKAAEECAQIVTPGKSKIANFSPFKDANEMLTSGKGSQIAGVIFEAKMYRPDGIVAANELTLEYLVKDEDVMSYDIPPTPYSMRN